jgi:hypothetical protein
MKNVTISLDEELARWARVAAARREKSLSRFVSDLIRERMHLEEGSHAAMVRFFEEGPEPLKRSGRYPGREELHDRDSLR